jgi:outer membrane lipoprotein carrier protein
MMQEHMNSRILHSAPRLAWLALLACFGLPVAAQDEGLLSGAAAVQRLESILQQTQSLSASVLQLQMDQDGRELQESQAELVMRKPSSFYWELTEPYNELMVTDGDRIWRYEPDLEQVTIQPFDAELDRTPIMLLNGDAAEIAATYEVSMGAQAAANVSRFILVPRSPSRLFERLAVTFRGAELIEMQFEDSLGQQTSLSFDNIVRNQPLSAEQFSFTPPAGVEIIDTTED